MQGATNLFGVIDTLLALKSFFCAPFAKRIKAQSTLVLLFFQVLLSVSRSTSKSSQASQLHWRTLQSFKALLQSFLCHIQNSNECNTKTILLFLHKFPTLEFVQCQWPYKGASNGRRHQTLHKQWQNEKVATISF